MFAKPLLRDARFKKSKFRNSKSKSSRSESFISESFISESSISESSISKSSEFKQVVLKSPGRTGQLRVQPVSRVEALEFDRAVNLYTKSYRGQTISKTSECYALLKFCFLESWFGYNRSITLKELAARANRPTSKASRLMTKGVAEGRYIASPEGRYLPSFGIAQDVAKWLQASQIPFSLTAGNFCIQVDVSYFRFAINYLLVQQQHTENLGATAHVLMLQLIKRELIHGLKSTATDLSAALKISKSTVSDTLHLLIEKGYVITEADTHDDRRIMLWLNLSEAHSKGLDELLRVFFARNE